MRHKVGDFVRNPRAREWGIGRVQDVSSDEVTVVLFTLAGIRRMWLDNLPVPLELLPGGPETLIAFHRESLENRGLAYRGVKTAVDSGRRRITHCYNCQAHLDNATDVECNVCNWIICCCGACGCGYGGVNR
jgi:hypothetical protein